MSEHELAETDGGEKLIEGVPLTPKEELFVRAFCDVESETFGRAVKSAAVAQYVEPRNAAWKLRRRPRIIARIAEYEKLVRVQIGKVLSDLEHERLAALEKGDIASAIRASELQGKHLAMFTDKVAVDYPEIGEYDERAALDARRITVFLLTTPPDPALLDAPVPAAVEAQAQELPGSTRASPADLAALERKPQAPQERQERESAK